MRQRPRAGDPYRRVVSEQFDQQPHRRQGAAAADEPGESGVHRGEGLQHQIVAGPQVRTLVPEDGVSSGSVSAARVPH